MGHINNLCWDSTESEYKAQLFALKTMYKYFPKQFNITFTEHTIKRNKKPHSKGFKRALEEFTLWKNKPSTIFIKILIYIKSKLSNSIPIN